VAIDRAKLDLKNTGYCGSFNFRRTARAVTRLYDTAMQESGLRSTQFAILVGIAKCQPVAIGALGETLVIDATTLTRSLRLLKKDRLISVSKRAKMRQRFLNLTPKGEEVLARSLPAWRKVHQQFVETLGAQHWIELRNELENIAQVVVSLEESKESSSLPAGSNL
jgi:DNA-binding MarR family transcriptional regulator